MERENHCNLEVMWLKDKLTASYKAIAEFRKYNVGILKNVHKEYISMSKELALFDEEVIGIDGSFIASTLAKPVYIPERN